MVEGMMYVGGVLRGDWSTAIDYIEISSSTMLRGKFLHHIIASLLPHAQPHGWVGHQLANKGREAYPIAVIKGLAKFTILQQLSQIGMGFTDSRHRSPRR